MAVNQQSDEHRRGDLLSKVPQVTLMFWVIKIFATTLGETDGDAVTMTLNLGYAVGSLIFLGFFAVTLAAGCAEAVPPVRLLGHRNCHHDRRQDDVRLLRA
jgi:uncharacterized membrane-anchored protein